MPIAVTFSGQEILECDQAGMTPLVPKPLTSNSKAEGRFDKRDFIYIAEDDEYRCPAGQRAIKRFTTIENGMTLHKMLAVNEWVENGRSASRTGPRLAPGCPLKAQCTTERPPPHRALGARGRFSRRCRSAWTGSPDAMKLRRQTVEHPFGTLKAWMGCDPLS